MADILENPVDLIDDAYEQEIQVEQEPIEVTAYRSYNQLDDKPQINGVELVGNKTSSDLGITAQIESAVNSEAQARAQADNTLQGKIDTEKLARQQADSTLQGNIDAEETARKAADKDIQDVLDGETLARQNADTAIGGRIDTEIHDRQVADIALQGQIDAITSKSDVVDVVATYADLQAYDTQHLGDNDVIKVLDDETHGDALTYYRWSKTNQTWTFIGQEAPYYSKSQTDTLLLGKQNTIDSSHKLSADLVDDTSTNNKFVTASDITNWNAKQDALTAGTGIDITGGVISTPAIVPEVVTELPTTGAEGKLYLTPKAHTTSTATGNPIEATITAQAGQLESFQLDGDTFQQSYTGKNLTPNIGSLQWTSNNITNRVIEDDEITFTTSTSANFSGVYVLKANNQAICEYYFESGYTVSFEISASETTNFTVGQSGGTQTSYTVGTTPVRISAAAGDANFVIYATSRNGASVSIKNIQVEAGSTATDFEPFVGGQPSPSPEYPQQIQTVTGEQTVTVVGKNLIDPDGLELGNIDASGDDSASQQVVRSGYIRVIAGSYTLKVNNSDNNINLWRYAIYDNSKTFVSANTPQAKSATITIANNGYIRVSFYNVPWKDLTVQEIIGSQVQLELGSTATAYAPYSKQTLPLDLGTIELCKLGTYQDYIYKDGENWKVHKATDKVILTGDEQWSGNNISEGFFYTYTSSYDAIIPFNTAEGRSSVADFYDGVLVIGTSVSKSVFSLRSNSATYPIHLRFKMPTQMVSSRQEWVSYLRSHETIVYYTLATPTDTTITDTTLIAQLEAIRTASLENGTNTITNTATGSNLAGDMEIGYFGFNPTNRYDKWLWLDLNNEYEQIGS